MNTKLSADQKWEYLCWTRQGPDAIGECDCCHNEGKLWNLPWELDDEPDAGWQYCGKCVTRIIEKS